MVFDVSIKPRNLQKCIIYTKKGICFAIWSECAGAFVTPHFLSDGIHYDVLYWQPLEVPEGVPTNYMVRDRA
jgi:hypothetical protein